MAETEKEKTETAVTGEENVVVEEAEEAAVQQRVEEILESDLSVKEKIAALYDLGYSRKKLIEEFDFNEKTVYAALPVKRDRKGKNKDPDEDEDSKAGQLPAVRKMGRDVEVITPEVLLGQQLDGSIQERWEYRGMMKLRAAMLMVMDMVNLQKTQAEAEALRLKPLLQLLSFSREEIDAAAQRARNSSYDIARMAAGDALGGYTAEIDKHLPKQPPAPPPKDMEDLLMKPLGQMVDLMTKSVMSKFNPQAGGKLEGWEYEDQSAPGSPQPATTAVSPAQVTSPAVSPATSGWEVEEQTNKGGQNV